MQSSIWSNRQLVYVPLKMRVDAAHILGVYTIENEGRCSGKIVGELCECGVCTLKNEGDAVDGRPYQYERCVDALKMKVDVAI